MPYQFKMIPFKYNITKIRCKYLINLSCLRRLNNFLVKHACTWNPQIDTKCTNWHERCFNKFLIHAQVNRLSDARINACTIHVYWNQKLCGEYRIRNAHNSDMLFNSYSIISKSLVRVVNFPTPLDLRHWHCDNHMTTPVLVKYS